MFRTLWRNPTDCLPKLSPAGTVVSGLHRRFVTQAIRRTSQEIRESKEGEGPLASLGDTRDELSAAPLNQGVDNRFSVGWHRPMIGPNRPMVQLGVDNHVLKH